MSLDPNDRDQIVRLSSDFTIASYQPRAIDAEKLYLSTLGAWMDVLGDWQPPLGVPGTRQAFGMLQWRHKAAMARDNDVRVVYAGYFLPGGHCASPVKVTERKFQLNASGNTTAYLRQHFFLVPREPLKNYGSLSADEQRSFPFRQLRITTLITPDLESRQMVRISAWTSRRCWLVAARGTRPFRLPIEEFESAHRKCHPCSRAAEDRDTLSRNDRQIELAERLW